MEQHAKKSKMYYYASELGKRHFFKWFHIPVLISVLSGNAEFMAIADS